MAENESLYKTCLKGFKKVSLCLGITAISITCFAITTSIHISMIVIGSIYFKECPASPNIPIFMIGHGAVSIACELFLRYLSIRPLVSLTALAVLAFHICGCVWSYGAFQPQYDPAYGDEYCHKTLYLFALIYVSIVNGLLALSLLLTLCFVIGTLICVR